MLSQDLKANILIVTDPKAMRVLVSGDVLALDSPTTAWAEHFLPPQRFSVRRRLPLDDLFLTLFLQREGLIPLPSVLDTISPLGRHPSKKVRVVQIFDFDS